MLNKCWIDFGFLRQMLQFLNTLKKKLISIFLLLNFYFVGYFFQNYFHQNLWIITHFFYYIYIYIFLEVFVGLWILLLYNACSCFMDKVSSLVFWELYSMCNIFSSTHCIVSFLLDFFLFSLLLVSVPCCCNSKMWGSVAHAYFHNPVVKPKFTCRMHSDTGQT